MKVLMFGRGVIGCLYGMAFKSMGHEVTHYIRKEKEFVYGKQLNVDILDKRKNQIVRADYLPLYTSELNDSYYDLIIVSVRHYQVQDVASLLSRHFDNTPILFFGNNWGKLDELKKEFRNSDKIFFGMPRAGGHILDNKLQGAILKEIILENSHVNIFINIKELFQKSFFKISLINNMEHWYWTHLATTCAWICGGVEARGYIPFSKSIRKIKIAINIGKEALMVAKARGADISICKDAQPFIIPSWLSAIITKSILVKEETIRISEGHGDYAKEEMTRIYSDIKQMAQQLNVNTPLLNSYQQYFDLMNNNF